MEPEFKSLPAFTIVGAHHRGETANAEIPALWQKHGFRLSQLESSQPGVYFGLCDNFDCATRQFDYVAGVAIDPESATPEGYVRWEVPAQNYAVFSTTLPKLMETFHAIQSEWLPTSGKRHAGGPEFERYGPDFDGDPSQPLTLWIPIQEAL
jgi:AraC family transcriptional regulator